jgi:hypothetical protein
MARYDLAIQLWIQRANRFSEASSQYRETHILPKPEEVGLPALPVPAPSTSSDLPAVKKDK